MTAGAWPRARTLCLTGGHGIGSRTLALARWCSRTLTGLGSDVTVLTGAELSLPFYRRGQALTPAAHRLLREARDASGIVVISASYHASVPGLLKNAIDYFDALGDDERPYLDGRTFGSVAVGDGPQGAATTLACLRTIGHALRAWPTPLGVALCGTTDLDPSGLPASGRVTGQLHTMLRQVVTGPSASPWQADVAANDVIESLSPRAG